MKIKELKEYINDLTDDMEIICQKDSEGNGYSPLHCADSNSVYVADGTYSGEVYSLDWTADDACMNDDEWKEINLMPRVLVLCPIN